MKCPTCGRCYVPIKTMEKAMAKVAKGMRPAQAARELGISRQLLHIRMKRVAK